MATSNEKEKRKVNSGFPAFLITVAIIFLFTSFIAFWNGSIDYRMQSKQKDWPVTNAVVSNVEKKTERQNKNRSAYYNIYYEYKIEKQTYTGIIENQNKPKDIGELLEVKYNPESPTESTHISEPSKVFIVSGSITGVLGLIFVVVSIRMAKKVNNIE